MSTEETPTLAAEAGNDVTTLALAPESESLVTTVPLEKKKTSLEFWCARRDLHDSGSKTYKSLDAKVGLLRVEYERELDAWRGRKLQEPAKRLDAKKRRAETVAKKKRDLITDIVDKVTTALGADAAAKKKAMAAVSNLLEPAEEPKKKQKRSRVEADDSD